MKQITEEEFDKLPDQSQRNYFWSEFTQTFVEREEWTIEEILRREA